MICCIQIAQFNPVVGAIAANAARIIAAAAQAQKNGANLLLFPELALTGYPPEDLLLRPEFLQRVESALAEIRNSIKGITLVLGYPLRTANGLFNVAGVLRDGAVIAEYAKQQLPNYSVFDEKRYFQSGTTPTVFEQDGIRFGLSVCEDIWQDAPTRQAAAAGAQVILNLNASPFHAGKIAEREALVARRAVDHGVAIVYANLVGGQDELVFDGASFVVNRSGEIVARAAGFVETTLTVEVANNGLIVKSLLETANSEESDELATIYSALVLGVRDYVYKNGFSGAVLGLSGGVDSALTLALAVDALGAERVEAVLMPSRYTADMSNADALEQAQLQGVTTQTIPIEPAFQAFLTMLAPSFAGQPLDVTEENIQARCRGVILMAISNKTGRILLTTGNKSEMAVGYATLYGDMAGGFAPLKDVPKMLVYRLARYRNAQAAVIPERVLTRPPSAELRPEQTDQDSLPPYDVLDVILQRYIEEDQSVDSIVALGYSEEIVRRVTRMVDRNEYKRRQSPPGVRISTRAFGRDRRYPITSGF
ncbi:NAD+ synthase [Chromatium weissei]|nr:NAD+ synthase [Chromatium weissei]